MLLNAGVFNSLTRKCASRHSGVQFLTSNLRKVVRTPQFFHILTYKYASRHSGVPFLNIATSKWLRRWGVFYIFTYKYASRHSRVAFWNIGTSKMAPALRCFLHFDLPNMLFATAAWHFGTLELPKCLRRWGVFYNLTRKCAFRHSRVPFFTCPRNSYLRTRRFSEATFRTSGTTTHWKNTAIRDVTNICRACWTPCYWLYTHVDLLATDMTAVRLCFSTLHIVGS